MRSLGWALKWSDLCPYEKGKRPMKTDTQGEDHVAVTGAEGRKSTQLWGSQVDQVWLFTTDIILRQRDQWKWWGNKKGIYLSEADVGKAANPMSQRPSPKC